MICAVLVLLVCQLADGIRPDALSHMDFLVLGYLLLALAVSFARGDALQENVGDSGSRRRRV